MGEGTALITPSIAAAMQALLQYFRRAKFDRSSRTRFSHLLRTSGAPHARQFFAGTGSVGGAIYFFMRVGSGAQSNHAGGIPCNQPDIRGLSRPPLAVAAFNPFKLAPGMKCAT